MTEQKLTYNGIFPKNAVPRDWNDMGRVNLDFRWEIDFWGKNRAALAAALSEARAMQADAAAARLLLTTAVANSYIRLEGFYAQRDIAVEALRNRRDSEQLVLRRVEEGLDSQGSVELAKTRTSLAQAEIAELDEWLDLTKNSIAALLGQGPDRGLSIKRPSIVAHRAFGLPKNLKLDLIGRKPEIVAARLRVEAAAKRIGVAKSAFYQRQLGEFIHAQMQAHHWEKASGYEVVVSKGFTALKPLAFTAPADDAIRNARMPVDDKSKIAQMVFGGFDHCLYPVQKFQSDTERVLSVILDRETTKWFKPGRGQFQIFYKWAAD